MRVPLLNINCMTSLEQIEIKREIIKLSVMKHRIFLTICLALLAFVGRAQQGLSVNALFTGKIVPREEMVEVRVKGRAITKYRLQFYHSVRFKANEQQRKSVDELVERDRKLAAGIEQTNRHGTETLIMSLPQQRGLNRYLCYLTQTKDRSTMVTVVYMEGNVASIAELRKLIN